MTKFKTAVVGIHQVNSVDFIKKAFQVYNSGDALAILKGSDSGLTLRQEITPDPGGGWLDIKQPIISEDRPAQIVFTSGTESTPKAILLSHKALADVVIRLNRIMKVDASIREYVGIPVTYSFGFGRCRAVAAVGGKCFIPENGFNPAEISRMLESGEINAISAVPTLWRTLLSQPGIIGERGKKVKWIEIGSQYMSREEKEKMKQLFPNANIIQHYGLTEASRSTFLDISKTKGHLLESVGQAFGDVEIQLSPEGRIMIRGPHVAMGQVVDGEVRSLIDADGWYVTGDFGRMEGQYLYYGGRADDLINCAGIKVNPDFLQENINRRLNVENKIAVCRISDDLRGEGFFVAMEEDSGLDVDKVFETVMEELLALDVNAKSSIMVQEIKNIPRTDTGKVRRNQLVKLYSAPVAESHDEIKLAEDSSVYDLFSRIFINTKIKSEDTFSSLGGDSLNYVQMLVLLEEKLGSVPADWDKIPIKQLDNIKPKSNKSIISWVDTSIFLRAMAIGAVVSIHAGLGIPLSGATWLLFIIIGYNLARFKANDIISGKILTWFFSFALLILIPYYLMAVSYQLWMGNLDIDMLLLYENLTHGKFTPFFPFWFVQVLLQCLILISVMFAFPAIRRLASKKIFTFSLALLIILFIVNFVFPYFWEPPNGRNLVPSRFMVIIWLGWTLYYASKYWERTLVCAIGITLGVLEPNLTAGIWMAIGSVFLAFVPRIPVLYIFRKLINDIGAATYFIFIFNGLVIISINHFFVVKSGILMVFLTMVSTMSIWWVMERIKVISKLQSALK